MHGQNHHTVENNNVFESFSYVIFGVQVYFNNNEIKQLCSSRLNCDEAQRIKCKANEQVGDTETCILRPNKVKLPSYIARVFLRFKLRPFIANAMRCKECPAFAHTAKRCRKSNLCSYCTTKGQESGN